MKENPSSIDRLDDPASPVRRAWAAVGGAGVILSAVFLFGVNRNLLYLSMLFSIAVMMSAILRKRWTNVLGLGFCAFLACVPAKVPDLGVLYPAPRERPDAGDMWVGAIGEQETWSYRFVLGDTDGRSVGADWTGFLYVDGRKLSSLVVKVQGRNLNGAAFLGKKNGFDHLAIPLTHGEGGALMVSLSGMPHTTPKVFRGPEVHGLNVYGDAVWLEFTRGQDRVICEAKRIVTPSRPR